MFKLIALLFVLGTSSTGFSAFTPDEVVSATKLALEDFKTSAHAEHFYGFKSWKNGDDAKVKVYFQHDGATMDVEYLCHQHDGSIECHGGH